MDSQKQSWRKEQCAVFTRNIQLSLVRDTCENRADSFAQIWNWSPYLKMQTVPSRVNYTNHRKHFSQASFQNIPCGPGSNKQRLSQGALERAWRNASGKLFAQKGRLHVIHTQLKNWKIPIIKYKGCFFPSLTEVVDEVQSEAAISNSNTSAIPPSFTHSLENTFLQGVENKQQNPGHLRSKE